MKTIDTPSKYSFLHFLFFFLLILAIVLNVSMFSGIRQSAGKRWGALYSIENPNVFDHTNIRRFGGFYGISSPYIKLGKLKPHATVVSTSNYPFMGTNKVTAFARTLGHVENIIVLDLDSDPLGFVETNLEDPAVEGDVWLSTSSRKRDPPFEWSIYLSDNQPSDLMLFVNNVANTKWYFVESTLLPVNIQEEISSKVDSAH